MLCSHRVGLKEVLRVLLHLFWFGSFLGYISHLLAENIPISSIRFLSSFMR